MNNYVTKALEERRTELEFSVRSCENEAKHYVNEIVRLQGRITELRIELDDINAARKEYTDAINEINSLLDEDEA